MTARRGLSTGMGRRDVDLLVVGAGIAGLSAAAELARDRRVAVVEAEALPATHTTGRSAAQYIAGYGGPSVQPFTEASRAWFDDGGGFAERALLAPRGMLVVAAPGGGDGDPGAIVGPLAAGGEPVTPAEAVELFPALRPDRVAAAHHDPGVCDIDVAEAVAACRRALAARGGTVHCGERVVAGEWTAGSWRVSTTGAGGAGTWRAGVVVDAAGAWGDVVAAACGVAPVGLRPMRRTACTFRAPDGLDTRSWPLVCDADDRWYVKPEPGSFMASPADETPSPPGDARPDEVDVARTLDHVRENTTLPARSITSSWAGLRTFAPDRALVLGPDPAVPAFVWCVGQGGFGIQSAPAAAATVAALVRAAALPEPVAAAGLTPATLSAARLR